MLPGQKKIRGLENKSEKLFYNSLPQLMFLIGIIGGVILNLLANIIHDQWRGNPWYMLIVTIFATFVFIFFFWIIKKAYVNPLNKLDKKIDELKKKSSSTPKPRK